MGHKVNPTGFRIGVIRDWEAKWYADKHYADFLHEDLKLRRAIQSRYADAAVSSVEVERQVNQLAVTIHTARPGIVIGRGGQRVDETRRYIEDVIGKRVQLNIREIQQPELDAYLVARAIAEQIERRIVYRRAMKQAMFRTMQAGAKGMRVRCAGRLGGAEIARRLSMHEGQVPLHTIRADIDYGFTEARTPMGRIGVKVWIYKGEILPETKAEEVEQVPTEQVTTVSVEALIPAEAVAEVSAEKITAPVLAEVIAEVPPAVEPEEKPAKPVVRRRRTTAAAEPKAIEVSAEVTPAAEPEEKPAKPVRRRRAATAAEPKAAEVGAEGAPAVEEKPAKPVARRRTKAAVSPEPKTEEAPAGQAVGENTVAEPAKEQGDK